MNYLLDTNVLSEVRWPRPDAHVLAWLDQADEERLYLSVITLAELARGVALLSAGKRKTALAEWLDRDLQARFGRRLLSVDGETAFIWGRLMADARLAGRALSVMDGWIAAIAHRHQLAVATEISGTSRIWDWNCSIRGPEGERVFGLEGPEFLGVLRIMHIGSGPAKRNVIFLSSGC